MKLSIARALAAQCESLPARGRGLKLRGSGPAPWRPRVAPRTGAWIETAASAGASGHNASLPARGRGLKQKQIDYIATLMDVAPRTGAWIETALSFR